MTSRILKAAIAAGVLGAGALGASSASASLTPGQYNLAGIQTICVVAGGTWYGETFSGWSGKWFVGPVSEDGYYLQGNYGSGVGNDSITVGRRSIDWSEWRDDGSFNNFVDGALTRVKGACTPPASRANLHKNPLD